MNPNKEKPIKIIDDFYKRLYQIDNDQIVLENDMNFTIIEGEHNIWDTECISDDGFKDIIIDSHIIKGKCRHLNAGTPVWKEFEYNISSKKLKYKWAKYFDQAKKKWWHI